MRHMRRFAKWIIVSTAALYLALVAALFVMQRSFIYLPWGVPGAPAASGLPEMQEIRVRTADGLDILGWHAAPRLAGAPTLVLFHGNAGHLGLWAGQARAMLDAGLGVLIAGYRGYGGNPGSPSEQGLYHDARAALDWLGARGVAGRDVVLLGVSLGTGVASQMANERPVAAIVLETPYTSVVDIAAALFPFVPVRWLLLDRFDTLSRIAAVRAPVLVAHGDRDDVIPFAHGEAVFAAASDPKRFLHVPGGDHGDLWLRGIGRAVIEFALRRGL
jgi:uncharacterized protein